MRLTFQNPASEVMEGIIMLHHRIFFFIIIILTLVGWMLLDIVYEYGVRLYIGSKFYNKEVSLLETLAGRRLALKTKGVIHGKVIETIWTIIPSFVLVAIAIPSFALLYAMDELIEPTLTLKAIGHQWYWSYEYSDFESDIVFDSYMVPEEDLQVGDLRLLEVDRKVWLPIDVHVWVIITSTDVLHCWAVPALGVKLDAVPGWLNQTSFVINWEGLFFGQCSELCGVNHGFMPIAVKGVNAELFSNWVEFNLKNN